MNTAHAKKQRETENAMFTSRGHGDKRPQKEQAAIIGLLTNSNIPVALDNRVLFSTPIRTLEGQETAFSFIIAFTTKSNGGCPDRQLIRITTATSRRC